MESPLSLIRTDFVAFVLLSLAIIEAIALHEFAHAWAADVQGDRLPRAMGRLSLNPVRQLDPLGTLLILLVGFGWGKPVEFRQSALSSRRFGAAIVALAGPAMNLLLAYLGALAIRLIGLGSPTLLVSSGPLETITRFLIYFSGINVILAVFNLIPLPPLDGSRLLTIFLPPRRQNVIFFLDRYGFLILLALLFFAGTTVLGPLIDAVQHLVFSLAGL